MNLRCPSFSLLIAILVVHSVSRADVIVAEGEQFKPQDNKGWKVTHQNDSYGSHTYGGMWMTHGGCLGADSKSADSIATQTIAIKSKGKYRVWSKYQAPPYFNYLHQVEIYQQGKLVYTHNYGKKGTDRLWSFSGVSDELWWPWGVDHDAAEAPKTLVELQPGEAEIRLKTIKNIEPAGDRFVDFILITTNHEDNYQGFKPFQVGTPFAMEALAATKLFIRFQHTSAQKTQLTISRSGHFQPQYGGETTKIPSTAIEKSQWSEWINIGPFCRLVHDEGLTLSTDGKLDFRVQFARDSQGKNLVGDLTVKDGDSVIVPIDITWNLEAKVKTAREHAAEIVSASKTWRRANDGRKPKEILFYGSFPGNEEWVTGLKDRLGFNTLLPDQYEHIARDGLHAHAGDEASIKAFAKSLKDKSRQRIISFGDEIGLGKIDYKDPKMQTTFREWLKKKGINRDDLGSDPSAATLTESGDQRLIWYSNIFNEETRFGDFKKLTDLAKKEIGPHVLTGANYSPHHLALYYGPIYQWIDIFKFQGMSMIWAEDYIFSVPEVPQIISWQFAQMRCASKYHQTPIHFYLMPHAPGQTPANLRRNLFTSIGYGAKHIDLFWVAPAERFTENYVGWNYRDTFKTISEGIFDTAQIEKFQTVGKLRPSRIALITGKATDFNESRLMVPKSRDLIAKDCKNAPESLNQIICRKDQQMLYLALKQSQYGVDTITEDDITDLDILKNYDVVYFAGEWLEHKALSKIDTWVKNGGIFYATAGCGHRNEFDAPDQNILKLLGLSSIETSKNVAIIRTLLELPLLPAIDSIKLNNQTINAIGMKQTLQPTTAKVLGTWSDGKPAITVNQYGNGRAYAVGTLAGNTWMKTGLKVIPYARGGNHTVYHPSGFTTGATELVRLAINDRKPIRDAQSDSDALEIAIIDHRDGCLCTIVNWSDQAASQIPLKLRIPFAPKSVLSVQSQKLLKYKYDNGVLTVLVDVSDADYLQIMK